MGRIIGNFDLRILLITTLSLFMTACGGSSSSSTDSGDSGDSGGSSSIVRSFDSEVVNGYEYLLLDQDLTTGEYLIISFTPDGNLVLTDSFLNNVDGSWHIDNGDIRITFEGDTEESVLSRVDDEFTITGPSYSADYNATFTNNFVDNQDIESTIGQETITIAGDDYTFGSIDNGREFTYEDSITGVWEESDSRVKMTTDDFIKYLTVYGPPENTFPNNHIVITTYDLDNNLTSIDVQVSN